MSAKKNIRIHFLSSLDYIMVISFIVEQYELFYESLYFSGSHITDVMNEQPVQVPYAKAISYIAESKFGTKSDVRLNYIIILRYYMRNMKYTQEYLDQLFGSMKIEGDRYQKIMAYQQMYNNMISKSLGQYYYLNKVLDEVKNDYVLSIRIQKIKQRINLQHLDNNDYSSLLLVLDLWNNLDKYFSAFWKYDTDVHENILLENIVQLNYTYYQLLYQVKKAKKQQQDNTIYDILLYSLNRYFQFEKNNILQYKYYYFAKTQMNENLQSIILSSQHNYNIINHYFPSKFKMRKYYNIEPYIVITQYYTQLYERIFEYNAITPVSVSQVYKNYTNAITTYGPDYYSKLRSIKFHYNNNDKRIKLISKEFIYRMAITISIVTIFLTILCYFCTSNYYNYLEGYYYIILERYYFTNSIIYFQKQTNVLLGVTEQIKYNYYKIVDILQRTMQSITSRLYNLSGILYSCYLFTKNMKIELTYYFSYFIIKSLKLSTYLTYQYNEYSDALVDDYITYSFPLTVNLLPQAQLEYYSFQYLIPFIMIIFIVPSMVFIINQVIITVFEHDYSILLQLFLLLPEKIRAQLSKHYTSLSKIRSRYFQIYGLDNVSQYLDVVISGNYFDTEIVTDLTFYELLSQYYYNVQDDSWNNLLGAAPKELDYNINVSDSQHRHKKRKKNLVQILDITCIFILLILTCILTTEYYQAILKKNEYGLLSNHIKEQFIKLSHEQYVFYELRLMSRNESYRQIGLDNIYKLYQYNNLDTIVIELQDAINNYGFLTQQIARAIYDVLSFSINLHNNELLCLDFIINGTSYYQYYDFHSGTLYQLLYKYDNCFLQALRSNYIDGRLSYEQIDRAVEELLYGCQNERIISYIHKYVDYIFKELDFYSEYYYLEKTKDIFFLRTIKYNYYSRHLGYNIGGSVQAWPYIYNNNPADVFSYKSLLLDNKEAKYYYFDSLFINATGASAYHEQVYHKYQSFTIEKHFKFAIIAFDIVVFLFVLDNMITYPNKYVPVLIVMIFIPLFLIYLICFSKHYSFLPLSQELKHINIATKKIAEDYHIIAYFTNNFLTYKTESYDNYFESLKHELPYLIAISIKYQSMVNVGNEHRYPRVKQSELLPEQYYMENLLRLALHGQLPANYTYEYNGTKNIDENALNEQSVIRPLVKFTSHIQKWQGIINRIISHVVYVAQKYGSADILAYMQEFRDSHYCQFVDYILGFPQEKIDYMFLNYDDIDLYENDTTVPSLGWHDNHIHWSGYNYFSSDDILQDSYQYVATLYYSSEMSYLIYGLYQDLCQIHIATKVFVRDVLQNTDDYFKTLMLYLFILSIVYLVIFTCVFNYLMKQTIKNIVNDNMNMKQIRLGEILKITKRTNVIYYSLLLIIVTAICYSIFVFIAASNRYKQVELIYAQQSVFRSYNMVQKLDNLYSFNVFNIYRLKDSAVYTNEYLIDRIITEASLLLTDYDLLRIANVKMAWSYADYLAIATKNLDGDNTNHLGAGYIYNQQLLLKRIFENQQINFPVLAMSVDLEDLQRVYIDRMLDIEPKYINVIQTSFILDQFFNLRYKYIDFSPQEYYYCIIGINQTLLQMQSDINQQLEYFSDQYKIYEICYFSVFAIFIMVQILIWSLTLHLFYKGRFLVYLLRKLRTQDFNNLPIDYTDASQLE